MRGGGGFAGGGVTEEDKLDAATAKQVLRRTWRMLSNERRSLALGSMLVVLWTGTVVAGPALVRYGIDHGLGDRNADALNRAVIA